MRNTTAAETVATLRSLFARMGLPEPVVSDNGPQFVSGQFKHFTEMNGIIIIIVTSFAPISSKIKLSGATKPGD